MSKTIKQSVDSLKTTESSLESSLTNIKSALEKKGATVPSSTTYSGLPAIIRKFGDTFKIDVLYNKVVYKVYNSNGGTTDYQYMSIKLKSKGLGIEYYTGALPKPTNDDTRTFSSVVPGSYTLQLLFSSNKSNINSSPQLTVDVKDVDYKLANQTMSFNEKDLMIVLLIPIKTGVSTVYLNNTTTEMRVFSNNLKELKYLMTTDINGAEFSFKKTGESKIYRSPTKLYIHTPGVYVLDYDTTTCNLEVYSQFRYLFTKKSSLVQ